MGTRTGQNKTFTISMTVEHLLRKSSEHYGKRKTIYLCTYPERSRKIQDVFS